MTKLVWMSDPHFAEEGLVLGHDPRIRLQSAITHINEHHADAKMCIISGDMVNRGSHADYQALKSALSALEVPYFPMVGNHDDRKLFREVLPLPEQAMSDFVQYQVASNDGIFACLDTQMAGSDAGEFCEKRKAWLTELLKSAGETPVFLFMHHPPMPLGLPMQDTENMQNGSEFLDLVSQYDCVKYLFIGHVHRPISGVIRNIPFSTMRSVLYQAPPPRPEWNWETFAPGLEAPNIGIIDITNGSINLHYDQFCDLKTGLMDY